MDIYEEGITSNKANYQRKKSFWTKETDKLLLEKVDSYKGKINWKELDTFFNKSSKQCYYRYRNINPTLKKGYWSEEEEKKLKDLYDIHGGKWALISKQLGGSRSGKQIRHHYMNTSNPYNRKSIFSKEEDTKIIELYKSNGPKWKLISSFFDRRSPESVKNRFYNKIKQIISTETFETLKTEEISDEKKIHSPNILATNDKTDSIKELNQLNVSNFNFNRLIRINEEQSIEFDTNPIDNLNLRIVEPRIDDIDIFNDSYYEYYFERKISFDYSEGKQNIQLQFLLTILIFL